MNVYEWQSGVDPLMAAYHWLMNLSDGYFETTADWIKLGATEHPVVKVRGVTYADLHQLVERDKL